MTSKPPSQYHKKVWNAGNCREWLVAVLKEPKLGMPTGNALSLPRHAHSEPGIAAEGWPQGHQLYDCRAVNLFWP